MQGSFKLMEGDVHLGTFVIDSEKDEWVYEAKQAPELQPLIFRLFLQEQNAPMLSGDVVRNFIVGCAPEPNYAFIDALMERVGITVYDPLAFVAYNGGRFNTDKYYLLGPGIRSL